MSRAVVTLTVSAGILAAVLAGFLSTHVRGIDSASHSRVVTSLSKIQELDSELGEIVLKLRDGLLSNYDPLVASLHLMQSYRRDLEKGEHAIAGQGEAEIDRAMAQLSAKLVEEEALLDQFKSRHALLRNSFHYFPLAVEALSRGPAVPPAVRARTEALLRDILLLRVDAAPRDYEPIALSIEQMREELPQHPSAARAKLEVALRHARNVLDHQQQVDRLVRAITAEDFRNVSKVLADAHRRVFERNLDRASRYRFMLLLASLGLIAYAAYSFLRVRDHTTRLETAVEAQAVEIAERKRAEQALHDQTEQLRMAQVLAQMVSLEWDIEADRLSWSESPERLLGPRPPSGGYPPFRELVHPDDRQHFVANRQAALEGPAEHQLEYRIVRTDGELRWVTARGRVTRDADGRAVRMHIVLQDITARKQADVHLARLTRARRVMAECNQALVHAAAEPDLMHRMCEILVDSGGYRQAWIGLPVDDELKSIAIGGSAGYEAGYLEALERSWASDGRHHGVMGHVIATGEPLISQNILTDTRLAGRRARALDRRYQSSASLPLKEAGRIIGGISIYAMEPDAFDREELELLRQVGDDIAFGIADIRTRVAHGQAEKAARESAQRMKETFEQAAVGILRTSLDGLVLDANQKFCDMLGYVRDGLIGKRTDDISHPDDHGLGMQDRAQLARGAKRTLASEKRFLRKDGSIMWARRTMSAACDEAGTAQYIITVVEDITERKELERRFELTFDYAGVGMALVDLEDRYLVVNQRFASMLGYSAPELGRAAVIDHMLPEEHVAVEHLRETLIGGEADSVTEERRYLHREGHTIWVKRTLSLARDASGTPMYFINVAEDITESKEREVRYRTVFDNAAVGITRVDLDGHLADVNDRFCEMVGYAKEELLGKNIKEITNPNDYEEGLRYRAEFAHGRSAPAGGEKRFLRKDGAIVWARRTMSVVRDHAGNPQYLVSVVEDITERKRAEDARRESDERLRTIADNMPAVIGYVDAEERYQFVNRTYEAWYGVSATEIYGRTVREVVGEEQYRSMRPQLKAVYSGKTLSFERRGRWQKSDAIRTVNYIPHRDAENRVIGYYFLSHDITERRQAEAARLRLAAIVENSNDAIISRALDGTITSWNAGAERMFGYTAAEVVGQPVRLIRPPEGSPNTARNTERMLRGEVIAPYEAQRFTKDGRVIDVLSSISPIRNDAGEVIAVSVTLRDISPLKRAEAALQESEQMLRATFAQARVGIHNTSVDGHFRQVNEKYCDMLGYTREELLTMHLADINFPGHKDDAARLRKDVLSGAINAFSLEKQLMRKDGSPVWTNVTASAVRGPDGALRHFVSVVEDISERKRAEAALKESEERFRAAFEQAAVGMGLRSAEPRNPRWLRVNQRLCDIFGYTREELLQLTTVDLTPPGERDLAIDYNEQLRRGEISSYSREKRYLRKDGTIIWTDISLSGVPGPDGRPTHIISVIQDITERKRAEEARLAADARLTRITANIPDVVFQFRRAADGTFGFSYVSERVADLFGERVADVLADYRLLFRPVAPEHQLALAKSMLRSQRSGQPWSFETPIQPRNSGRKWMRGRAAISFDADGTVIWDGVLSDITLQKRAAIDILTINERLERRVAERTRQLEATNRELEAFSYSVSHDLRAPLRAIDGFSEVLLKQYGESFDETRSDYLRRIRRAALRMGELIDDLLQLSRLSRADVEIDAVDLSQIARAIVSELRESEPDREVALEVQDGVAARGDPRLLRIALENLLGNAWKFTRRQKPATIRFGAREQYGEHVIYVKDNGAGFDMKYAHKLFGAFQRLHGVNDFEGTGIGLATVQRIINLHGGRVWADAAVGQGATFYLVIPHSARGEAITTRQGERTWSAASAAN